MILAVVIVIQFAAYCKKITTAKHVHRKMDVSVGVKREYVFIAENAVLALQNITPIVAPVRMMHVLVSIQAVVQR